MKNDISILDKLYKDRQVIVNYYEDDELLVKDGFNFECIELKNNEIHFIKEGNTVFSISLDEFPHFKVLDDFKNFYSLSSIQGKDEYQIYFP